MKLMIFHHQLLKKKFNKVNHFLPNIPLIILRSFLAAVNFSDESDDDTRPKKKDNKQKNKQKKGGKQQTAKSKSSIISINYKN